MSVKLEQQIYRELCGLTARVLKSQNLEDWAKNVLQYGQCTQQEVPSPSVMIDYNDGAKYGWESNKYKWDKGAQQGKSEISYYRQIYVDFLFFRNPHDLIEGSLIPETPVEDSNVAIDKNGTLRMNNSAVWITKNVSSGALNVEISPKTPDYESEVYISPIDVAQRVRTWFLSDLGISSLRELGYGIIDSSEMENPTIETDDEVYARTPRFTLTLVVKETTYSDVDFVKDYDFKAIGV